MFNSIGDVVLLREAIYEFILRSGAAGVTDQEISTYLEVARTETSRRRGELVRAGRVMAMHPARRVVNRRAAKVWLSTRVVKKLLSHVTMAY